jgi:hypothetical protein
MPRHEPRRRLAPTRGRDHAHTARRGLHPEATALQVARHRPAGRDGLPRPLRRDPAFQPADAVEGGQGGAGLGLGFGRSMRPQDRITAAAATLLLRNIKEGGQ